MRWVLAVVGVLAVGSADRAEACTCFPLAFTDMTVPSDGASAVPPGAFVLTTTELAPFINPSDFALKSSTGEVVDTTTLIVTAGHGPALALVPADPLATGETYTLTRAWQDDGPTFATFLVGDAPDEDAKPPVPSFIRPPSAGVEPLGPAYLSDGNTCAPATSRLDFETESETDLIAVHFADPDEPPPAISFGEWIREQAAGIEPGADDFELQRRAPFTNLVADGDVLLFGGGSCESGLPLGALGAADLYIAAVRADGVMSDWSDPVRIAMPAAGCTCVTVPKRVPVGVSVVLLVVLTVSGRRRARSCAAPC